MKLLTIRDIRKKLAKRSDQIGEMEKSADTLQKWQEGAIPSELKMVSRHGHLIVMLQKQIDGIVVDLLVKMPEAGKLIGDKFEDLLRQAKWVDSLDADTGYFEDARLRGFAQELAETIRRIAEKAREERKWWIGKGIFYFISVLAALLTCIYFLWWLWTTFWKK